MEFFDATRESFRCAVCGELKNMDPYIAPRGIHHGERICKNCYEEAFAKMYGTEHTFICDRCHITSAIFDMHTTSDGKRFCGNCWNTAAESYLTETPSRIAYVPTKVGNMQTDISYPNEHSEPRLSDVIKVIYELNDSVRDLCTLLDEKL